MLVGRSEVQWNLDFKSLESTFYLFLHTFLGVLPKVPEWKCYIFCEITVVLSAHLLVCMFKLSISWRFAFILSTFNWNSERKLIFDCNFMSPLLSLRTLTTFEQWHQMSHAMYYTSSCSHQQSRALHVHRLLIQASVAFWFVVVMANSTCVNPLS